MWMLERILCGLLFVGCGLARSSLDNRVSSIKCPDEGITAKTSDPTTWPQIFQNQVKELKENGEIIVDFPLLVDSNNFSLFGLLVEGNGSLVFSPDVSLAKIEAHYIIVRDGGQLYIGSEECPYVGNAEIELVGVKDSYEVYAKHSPTKNGEKFLAVEDGGRIEIHGKPKLSWTKLSSTVPKGVVHTIEVLDDVSSWENNDKIVLVSTDFEMDQAEIVTVESCTKNICSIKTETNSGLKYEHYGQIDSGVDMRGEVGLLSRNILIHGRLEDYCHPQGKGGSVDKKCTNVKNQPDLFGGHIMAKGKFLSFKISNAEIKHMGQHGVLARYPIHWHMVGELPQGISYVRQNSIHHNLQRCVTCHGTFGCIIEDNVAFETFGHCYFMEDGVEKGTIMKGNLGANTRQGFMIPSDVKPSTYWITHPDVTIRENVAAGSEGTGFWFLYPYEPTGLTDFLIRIGKKNKEDYYGYGELHRTAPKDISKNTVHSSPSGYFYDNILTNVIDPNINENIGVQGTLGNRVNVYDIRKNPKNILRNKSDQIWTSISDITCYKAKRVCVWTSIERVKYTNLKIADSSEGMFCHEEGVIDQSLFVGESEKNFGSPNAKVNGNIWHRSLAPGFRGANGNKKFLSIGYLGYRFPVTITNTEFRNFFDEPTNTKIRRRAISIETADFKNVKNGVYNITFTNTPYQSRMVDYHTRTNPSIRQTVYNDYTGDLTSYPGSSIVSTLPHLISDKCFEVQEWADAKSKSVCPHKYASLGISMRGSKLYNGTVIQRDDVPEKQFSKYTGPFNEVKNKVKEENMYYLNTDSSYIASILEPFAPAKQIVSLFVYGLDEGKSMRIGLCLPRGASIKVFKRAPYQPVDTLDKLMEDNNNSKFFHDEEAGVVFIKATGKKTIESGDVTTDILKNKVGTFFRVTGEGGSADCRSQRNIYPKYSTQLDKKIPKLVKPEY